MNMKTENFIKHKTDYIREQITNLQLILENLQNKCPHTNLSDDWRHGDEFIVDCLDCGKEKINIK